MHKVGEILFWGVDNIKDLLFLKHDDRGKGHAMHEIEIKKMNIKHLKVSQIGSSGSTCQNLFKFKNFYNQMYCDAGHVWQLKRNHWAHRFLERPRLCSKQAMWKEFEDTPLFSTKKVGRSWLVIITGHFISQSVFMRCSLNVHWLI